MAVPADAPKPFRVRLTGHYESRRLGILQALAFAAEPGYVASFGADGPVLLSLARGTRRKHPVRVGLYDTVHCLHWGRGVELAKEFLGAHDAGCRPDKTNRHRRETHSHAARTMRVVRWIDCGEGRDGWRNLTVWPGTDEPVRYGLVVHPGTGEAGDILGDLETILPALSQRTKLALCGLERRHPMRVFERLVTTKGWSGIYYGTLHMAVLGRMPFAMKG